MEHPNLYISNLFSSLRNLYLLSLSLDIPAPVGAGDEDDVGGRAHAVHLDEELVEGLVRLPPVHGPALPHVPLLT